MGIVVAVSLSLLLSPLDCCRTQKAERESQGLGCADCIPRVGGDSRDIPSF